MDGYGLRHTATPYLIGTALRLADACDVIDAVVGSAALQARTKLKTLYLVKLAFFGRAHCCLDVMQCRTT